jgi:hypothetical protein
LFFVITKDLEWQLLPTGDTKKTYEIFKNINLKLPATRGNDPLGCGMRKKSTIEEDIFQRRSSD